MEKDLVSIMIPCYNGEKFLDRLFQSFLEQTYKKLQIIFINDGSVDKTEKIALYYKKILEKVGIYFIYLFRENGGQAAAINAAFPYINGEYCMWFDSDDYMTCNHIEKKVSYLGNHPDEDLVMCKGCIIEEDTKTIISMLGYEDAKGSLFEDLLFEFRRCTPGLFMVRTEKLFLSLKNKRIYESKAGQNLQLLLPVALKRNNGYLDEMLYYYVLRKDSHSHAFYCCEDMIRRIDALYDLRMHLIDELKLQDDYRNTIRYYIELFTMIQRIEQINEEIFVKYPFYISKVGKTYFDISEIAKNLHNRDLYIWGACQNGARLKIIIEQNSRYAIKGYIDSDEGKVGKKRNNIKTYNVKSLDKRKMYLLIPLEVHESILQILQEKSFCPDKDYFYPKYKLNNFVEKSKDADFQKE